MNLRRAFFLFAALLGASLVWPAAGQAETSLPSEQSRVVFSNGGRVVAIDSDGSNRKVLTRKGKIAGMKFSLLSRAEKFDRYPQLSPDGSRVLFFRQSNVGLTDSDYYSLGKTMVVDVRGGKPRTLFRAAKKAILRDVTWIPGSRDFLAVKRKGDFERNSVVVVGRNGKIKRTVLTLKSKGRFGLKRGLPPYFIATQLSVSPDGSKFLMTRQDAWVNSQSNLELVDLKTGKRRVVRKQARQGRWSPDGSRIAFVAKGTGPDICPDGDCREPYDVFIANAKGKNVHRVKATHYDEQWPSFSSDGRQLVFSANRNKPSVEESREIYRMSVRGTCVNWLTNGSPASVESDWGPGTIEPLGCGDTERQILAEGSPGPLDVPEWGPRFWFGNSHGEALFSSSLSLLGISLIDYRDCGEFRRVDCPKPVTIAQAPVCLAGAFYPVALQILNSPKMKTKRGKIRGVSFRTGYARGFSFALTFTGESVVVTLQRSGGVRSGRIDQLKLIRSIRQVKGGSAGRLPVFRVPVAALRTSRMVKRKVRRSGIRKAARQLRMSRWEIRAHLRLRANLRSVGPVKPVRCNVGKSVNRSFEIDSRTSSSIASRAMDLPVVDQLKRNLSAIEIPDQIERSLERNFLP